MKMKAIDDIGGFELLHFSQWNLLRLILTFGWLMIDFENEDIISRTSSKEFVTNNLETEDGIVICLKRCKEGEVILAQDL